MQLTAFLHNDVQSHDVFMGEDCGWALLDTDRQLLCRLDRTGNAEFCAEVSKWAFHERGVLRVSDVHHNKAGLSEQPDWYRITDDLEFSLDIHEFCEGSWKPYRWAQGSAMPQFLLGHLLY